MCGIICFSGSANAYQNVRNGLCKLEYRGYDSAGTAFIKNGSFEILKNKGRVKSVLPYSIADTPKTVIGHTRWATHGKASSNNAHPHSVGNVCIVHNGIIENHYELKEKIVSSGIILKSQTDTEIACALIYLHYKSTGEPISAIFEACKEFRGSYALCILFSNIPNTVYAVRKESPLLLIPFGDTTAICSDLTAIEQSYSCYYTIEENEIAEVNNGSIVFFDHNKNIINQAPIAYQHKHISEKLDGYKSFMVKEIFEQPTIAERIIKNYIINGEIKFDFELPSFSRLRVIACGTAYHAALTASYLFRNEAKLHTECFLASEFRYSEFIEEPDALYAVISQSGETADTIAAMRYIQEKGHKVLGIVNVANSTIAREADMTLNTLAGAELSVASTKAFTAQVLSLYLLCAAISGNKTKIIAELNKLPKALSDTLKSICFLENIAKTLSESEHAYYVGRQADAAIAREGSLKLKEITYIHSEAIEAGELKHGTLSLISEGTPVIAVLTNKRIASKLISNIEEIRSRGGNVFVLTTLNCHISCIPQVNIINIKSDGNNSLIDIFCVTEALQLIALKTAEILKRDVDKPRNLAKSVTVE